MRIARYRGRQEKSGRSTARSSISRCAGDDLKVKMGLSFTKVAKAKPGEVVVFSWILYKSRADRDRINRKVMQDPRLAR